MAKEKTKDKKTVEIRREAPTSATIKVLLVPQCVNCPHNKGAVDCAIFGEKPSEYMSNMETCPKEK